MNKLKQTDFFGDSEYYDLDIKFRKQLLKWVGNKQKFAPQIIKYFPKKFNTYFEPFLGSGGVLGVLSPTKAVASDIYKPLIEIWTMLSENKDKLKKAYADRYNLADKLGKKEAYEKIKSDFNNKANGEDLVFLCRACYGGVVRFRKADGFMSTPIGIHSPISPSSFNERVDLWSERVKNTIFINDDFKNIFSMAKKGDLIYCDPPYVDSQSILYGSQSFSLVSLFEEIKKAKEKGIYVALSIDGTKYSGGKICDIKMPTNIFDNEIFIELGGSMLKRFQMEGKSLNQHKVSDRLLLTY